jgi:hypothetical protein
MLCINIIFAKLGGVSVSICVGHPSKYYADLIRWVLSAIERNSQSMVEQFGCFNCKPLAGVFLMLFCQMIELSDDSTLSEVSLSLSSRNTSSKPRPPTVQRLQPHRTLAGRGVLYLRYKISMNVRSGPLHRSTASESKTDVKALYIPVLGTIHVPKPRTDGFPYISTLLPSHNHCE